MTAKNKIFFAAVLASLLMFAGASKWLHTRRQARIATLQAEIVQLEAGAIHQRAKAAQATKETKSTKKEAATPPEVIEGILASADRQTWLQRTRQLKELFVARPDAAIPELRLLGDLQWLSLSQDARFNTEEQIRKLLAAARSSAKFVFCGQLDAALRRFTKASGGQLPADITHLAAFFETPPDPTMLARYHMTRSGTIEGNPGDWAIEEKALIDLEYDSTMHVQAAGGFGGSSGIGSEFYNGLGRAIQAYQRANGREVEDPQELAAYFQPPLNADRRERFLKFAQQLREEAQKNDQKKSAPQPIGHP